MIFQGSRTIIKAEKRPPNSSSSLLHGSCGLFLQSERMIAHHTSLQKQQHPHIVSGECWCSDVAWRACKPGWQAPRKQPQPPPVKLWDVPVSKWALAAYTQFSGIENYSPNVSNMPPVDDSFQILHYLSRIQDNDQNMCMNPTKRLQPPPLQFWAVPEAEWAHSVTLWQQQRPFCLQCFDAYFKLYIIPGKQPNQVNRS